MSSTSSPVRVGLIGCGEIAQVVHIPTLNLLSTFFTITYLCDVSPAALKSCQGRALGTPKTTGDPVELCSSPEVDVVFVLNSNEYHADRAILALQNDKFVFLEKPVALNQRDLNRVRDVETASKGQVMVGYMRRYAPAFAQFREEIGDRNDILFARVRGKMWIRCDWVLFTHTMKISSDPTSRSLASRAHSLSDLRTFRPSRSRIRRLDSRIRLHRHSLSVGSSLLTSWRSSGRSCPGWEHMICRQ